MNSERKTYNLLHLASAICMILALLWLTISVPFMYASQQELAKHNKVANAGSPLTGNEEEAANPFSNTTEEKSSASGSVFSEEFLHDHHPSGYFLSLSAERNKCVNAGTYIAFHGELDVPPPDPA